MPNVLSNRAVWVVAAVAAAMLIAYLIKPASAEDCPVSFPNAGGIVTTGDLADATSACTDPINGVYGRDADIDKAMAIAAASSLPVWLGDKENFALSGGLGFTDGETALGATGVVRIEKNISAFAGGAVSTEDTDAWAGKVGGRIGF